MRNQNKQVLNIRELDSPGARLRKERENVWSSHSLSHPSGTCFGKGEGAENCLGLGNLRKLVVGASRSFGWPSLLLGLAGLARFGPDGVTSDRRFTFGQTPS